MHQRCHVVEVSRAIRTAVLIAGVALAALLVWRAGPNVVAELLVRVRWYFPVIACIYGTYVLIRAVALWRTMGERAVGFADVVRIRFSSEAVEQLTFTGPLLAEPAKGWLLATRGLTIPAAYAAVVTEYLLYMVVSSSLAVVGLLLLLTLHSLPTLVRSGALVVMAVTLAFLAAFTFASISGIGLITPALRKLRAVIGARAVQAAHAFEAVEVGIIDVLHNHPRRWAAVGAIELAAEATLVLEMWVIIGALGFSRSWTSALTIEGSIKFVGTAFLFIPGQFGASEGVYSLLARTLGLTAAAGLGVALVRRLRSVVIATAGVLVFARS